MDGGYGVEFVERAEYGSLLAGLLSECRSGWTRIREGKIESTQYLSDTLSLEVISGKEFESRRG